MVIVEVNKDRSGLSLNLTRTARETLTDKCNDVRFGGGFRPQRGMILSKVLAITVSVIVVVSCSNVYETKEASNTVVLKYSDFGPQSVAWETIGMEWWQWDNHGDSNQESRCDVRVVVYRGIPLEKVKKLYPVHKEKNQDYRYLEYSKAMEYLNKGIQEYSDHEWENLRSIADGLQTTRTRLFKSLGRPNDSTGPPK